MSSATSRAGGVGVLRRQDLAELEIVGIVRVRLTSDERWFTELEAQLEKKNKRACRARWIRLITSANALFNFFADTFKTSFSMRE
jgi:hypothetical protein